MAIAILTVLASCSPSTCLLNLQSRNPSKSGNDLGKKTMAVAYMVSGKDSLMNKSIAEGFAEALEAEYFGGDKQVALYSMEKKAAAGNYFSKDTLINLVLDSGQDVVFLFDVPNYGDVTVTGRENAKAVIPVGINLYLYDSMNKADTVMHYMGKTVLHHNMSMPANLNDKEALELFWSKGRAASVGRNAASSFLPVWKDESYFFYSYTGSQKWEQAEQYVYEFRWRDAMKIWIEICENSDGERRGMAEYNIAMACHLLGDQALALKWLDRCDADLASPYSASLREKIAAKK